MPKKKEEIYGEAEVYIIFIMEQIIMPKGGTESRVLPTGRIDQFLLLLP